MFKKHPIAISLAFMLFAQYGEAAPSTLLQVYEKAKVYDATVKAAKADNQAAQEEINKSFSAFLPQARVTAYEGRGVTDSETPGAFGTTSKRHSVYDSKNYNFSIRQSLYNGANFANYAQSKAEAAKSDATLAKEQLGLMGRVSGAYFDVLLAAENVQYSESQKKAASQQLTQAEKRFKAGIGTVTEINESKANLQTVVAQELEWLNGLEYAKRTLETISGIYLDQFFVLDPVKLTLDSPEPNKVEDWVDMGMKKNPEIMASMHDIEAAQEEISKNTAGHLPTLDLVASRSKTESDNNFTIGSKYETDSIGLQLNVPIYNGGYVSATVRQAQAKLEFSQEKLVDKQRIVANDIRKYFNEIVNGIARVDAQLEAVKSNEVAVIGTKKGFEAGMRSNVEVLNAQEKLFSAKRDLARERYKLLYNRVMLRLTAGVLTESDLGSMSALLTMPGNGNE